MWQVPATFAGQFAAIAYITGLQLGEPIPVDVVIGNAGLTVKVRALDLQRRHLATPSACLFSAGLWWLVVAVLLICVHLASSQEFFANVDEQHLRLHPRAPSLPQLKQLKEHFLASGVAWKKFDEFFRKLFPTGFVAPGEASSDSIEHSKKVGWLTFCMAKCLVLGTNSALLAGALPAHMANAGGETAGQRKDETWLIAAPTNPSHPCLWRSQPPGHVPPAGLRAGAARCACPCSSTL